VEIDVTELEGTAAESKATYEEIKEYVLEKTGLKVLVERCTIFGGSFNQDVKRRSLGGKEHDKKNKINGSKVPSSCIGNGGGSFS